MKNKTYVAIIDKGQARFITKVDKTTKAAFWEDGEKAIAMNKTAAEDLYFGLRCNGYRACMVIMPDYEEPENPKHNKGKTLDLF